VDTAGGREGRREAGTVECERESDPDRVLLVRTWRGWGAGGKGGDWVVAIGWGMARRAGRGSELGSARATSELESCAADDDAVGAAPASLRKKSLT
jgi:hypothetical protein